MVHDDTATGWARNGFQQRNLDMASGRTSIKAASLAAPGHRAPKSAAETIACPVPLRLSDFASRDDSSRSGFIEALGNAFVEHGYVLLAGGPPREQIQSYYPGDYSGMIVETFSDEQRYRQQQIDLIRKKAVKLSLQLIEARESIS